MRPLENTPRAAQTIVAGPSLRDHRAKGFKTILRQYSAALGCALAAFGIRYLLEPLVGAEIPFLGFIAAALVSAWYGGIGAGAFALILGFLAGEHFFIPPTRALGIPPSIERVDLIRYLVTTSLGIFLLEVLHRARRRAEDAAAQLRREVARREQSESALVEAQARLREHAGELEIRVAERTAKLEATIQSLQNVLYHVAHDLRAPLRAMQGFTSLLTDEYAPQLDATGTDYAQRIGRAATRMDLLIQDLLDYGRLGHMEIALTDVCLDQAVQAALFHFTDTVELKAAKVEVAEHLPDVQAHGKVLHQVLVNLLDNALKFVAPGTVPRIQIRAERCGPVVRLWIEDNGIGVDPEHHERIFQVFERLHDQKVYEGTGIGLAIVWQGMQSMQGRVGVESRLGAGSRFWLELRASEKSDDAPSASPRD